MICSWCGAREEPDERCGECGHPVVLDERYDLLEVLGQRGGGTTYLARARDSGDRVVVKELLLRASETLKEIELFEREASLLERLEHPTIPRHIEHFELERSKTIGLYNVQEYVGGVSLEAELQRHRFTESEVLEIIATLAETLAYLRTHDPPVVHRDLKPANLVRRDDGGITLVDFGAARTVAETLHAAGSTITGTFGYMAPEQLLGAAEPASDVYSLGATVIRLLTGREPHELYGPDRRFEWRDEANVTPSTADLVDGMTALAPAQRPVDLDDLADAALQAAEGSSRALVRFRPSAIVDPRSARPTVRAVARRFAPRRNGPTVFGLVTVPTTLVWLVWLMSVLGRPADAVAMLLVLVIASIAVLLVNAQTIVRPIRLLWLTQSGEMTRGIVTGRDNDGKRFKIKYTFDVDGEPFEGEDVVDAATYFEVPPGTEVDVFRGNNSSVAWYRHTSRPGLTFDA